MTLKKKLTIEDFHIQSYVDWREISELMGKRRYKKFLKWMYGQTTSEHGVYPWDLERYLNMINNGKPTYFD